MPKYFRINYEADKKNAADHCFTCKSGGPRVHPQCLVHIGQHFEFRKNNHIIISVFTFTCYIFTYLQQYVALLLMIPIPSPPMARSVFQFVDFEFVNFNVKKTMAEQITSYRVHICFHIQTGAEPCKWLRCTQGYMITRVAHHLRNSMECTVDTVNTSDTSVINCWNSVLLGPDVA